MKRKRTPKDRRRAPRGRGVPRWLTGRKDLDQVAQRRVLMILSVLSGHTPVTTAIAEHGISRPLYYQLETKGIVGMMKALVPGASTATSPGDATPMQQVVELEEKVARLEQENRRLERLLLLAKRVLPTGPVAFPERRGRKPGRRSTTGGPGPSPGSKKPATSPMASILIPTHERTVNSMARPRGPNEPSTYQSRPDVPTALQPRFNLIRAVIGERTSTSEAARELGIARVNMQSLVHRAEAAILSAMAPRPTGPTPKSDEEKQLEARIKQLEKENARLKTQLQAADDMMGAAGEIIRSLRGMPTKSQTTPSILRQPPTETDDDEDP